MRFDNYLATGTADGKPNGIPAPGFVLPEGGIIGVYDEAYKELIANGGRPNGIGNARPVQVSPDRIEAFEGTDFFGDKADTAKEVLPTVENSAAFPSGHSAFGWASSMLFAQMVPERYQEFMARGAEYADSRVVLGVHYALDTIGARIMTTYSLAQILNNNPEYLNQDMRTFAGTMKSSSDFQALFEKATNDLRGLLSSGCDASVAECVASGNEDQKNSMTDTEWKALSQKEREDYLHRLTYGLSAIGDTTLASVVPEGAEVLIQTRFPYLSKEERREVLATTQIESGHALDNGSGWARLNLYDAGGGYGAFNKDVTVTMDASKGGFNAYDEWSNNITGTGSLNKEGSGVLELSGDSTYTGKTIVSEGGLIVSGSLASSVEVKNQAFVQGTGSIAGLNIEEGGAVVVTNNSESGLKVKGDVNLATGAVYQVVMMEDGSHNVQGIESTGTTTIDNAMVQLEVIPTHENLLMKQNPQSLIGVPQIIVSSDKGITGNFSTVVEDYLFLDGVVAVTENDATNSVRTDSFAKKESLQLTLKPNDVRLSSVARNDNEIAVANAIEALGAGNGVYESLVTAKNPLIVQSALGQLSGKIYADIYSNAFNNSQEIRNVINDRLTSQLRGVGGSSIQEHDAGIWGTVIGNWSKTSAKNSIAGFDADTQGFMIGVDRPFNSGNSVAGIIAGYSKTDVDGEYDAKGDLHNYYLGIYGSHKIDNLRFSAGASYAWHKADVTRAVSYANHYDALSSDYRLQTGQLFAEIGYDASVNDFAIEPFINVAYVNVRSGGFTEKGHRAALRANKQSGNLFGTTLGIRLATDLGESSGFSFAGELGWNQKFGNLDRDLTLGFVDDLGSFKVDSVKASRGGVVVKAAVGYKASRSTNISLGYSGYWSQNQKYNSVNLGVQWNF